MFALKSILMCCLTFLTTAAFGAVNEGVTKEGFPVQISINYQDKPLNLQITGEATRKKFFVSVYDVAHYIQQGVSINPEANKFQSILNDNSVKQLSFKWLRTVEAAKVVDGFNESFKKILAPGEYSQLQNEISKFLGYFNQEVRNGDMQALRWLPDGSIEVFIKGNKVGTINNPTFAKALWSIWLGDKSVVDREKLVSF